MFKLDLEDLQPQEATFELSEYPGKAFVLRKFSLAGHVWMKKRFSKEELQSIFQTRSLPEISEFIYFLLKDKSAFPTLESLQEAIVTQKDRVAIITALLATIGLSQPVIKKISDASKAEESSSVGNGQAPDAIA